MNEDKHLEDKKKFLEMTKPLKFRKARLFFQSVGLTYEVGKERCKYLFNNLLYKLHIYKRFNYRDNVVKEFPIPDTIKPRNIVTNCLDVWVGMRLELVTHINQDYFYREKKDGSKKITYYLKNEESHSLFSVATLKEICLIVAGNKYYVDNLPTFRYAITNQPVGFTDFSRPRDPLKPIKFKTITYDVAYLKQLNQRDLIGIDIQIDTVSEAVIQYFYEVACREFREYLDRVTLEDLTLEVTER